MHYKIADAQETHCSKCTAWKGQVHGDCVSQRGLCFHSCTYCDSGRDQQGPRWLENIIAVAQDQKIAAFIYLLYSYGILLSLGETCVWLNSLYIEAVYLIGSNAYYDYTTKP